MKRIEAGGTWALMCPSECPGLADCHGEEFERLYEKYEAEGKYRKVIDAQKLWFAILESQTETGGPFMLYKVRAVSHLPSGDHTDVGVPLGRCQRQVKPEEPWHHQVVEPLHRDH